MKYLNSFDSFLNESKGIAPVIYSHLEKYFKEKGDKASFAEAKKMISDKVEGWDLSQGDFDEAKKQFSA